MSFFDIPMFSTDQNRERLSPGLRPFFDYLSEWEPRTTRGLVINVSNVITGFAVSGIGYGLAKVSPERFLFLQPSAFAIGAFAVATGTLATYQYFTLPSIKVE